MLPRRTLSMISSAVLCQTNGLGSLFQWSPQVSMASIRAWTLEKAPRRSRRSVNSLNHRSTRFSHELDVGAKCRCQRALFGSSQPFFHFRRLMG